MGTKRSLPDSNTESGQKRRKSEASKLGLNSFTPINIIRSSHTVEVHHDAEGTAEDPSAGLGQCTTDRRNNGARNPVVAVYLGLDESPSSSAAIESIISVSNCSPSAVRNYNDTCLSEVPRRTKQTPRKKRPKINTTNPVSDGMLISKPAIAKTFERCSSREYQQSPSTDVASPHIENPGKLGFISKQTINKLNVFRYEADLSSAVGQKHPSNSAAAEKDQVSVIAPVTSLDALRAQQGFGCTLYQGTAPALNSTTGGLTLSRLSEHEASRHAEKPRMNESIAQRKTAAPTDGDCHPNSSLQSSRGRPTALPAVESRNGTPSARSPAQGSGSNPDDMGGVSQMSVTRYAVHTELERLSGPNTDEQQQTCSMDEFLSSHDDDLADEDLLNTLLNSDVYDKTSLDSSITRNPQLPTPMPSDPLTSMCCLSKGVGDIEVTTPQEVVEDDWKTLDDDDELAFIDLTVDAFDTFQTSSCQGSASNTPVLRENRSSLPLIDKDPTALVSGACSVPQDYGQHLRPIVRPAFPQRIHDRPPIIGLSASMVLRTCFRVGEALNVGCQAARAGRTVIIELYARVSSSWREQAGVKQHFVFADLFHNRPPFINGIYECWKGVELWDYDSQRFLEQGHTERMCRCIGEMKREGNKWRMVVLNIWEASWDDIDHVKGIICS